MIRAHKIRLNPNAEQTAWLEQCCHIHRAAYNWGLATWIEQYQAGGKPSAVALKRQWNEGIDQYRPWAREGCRDAYASAFFDLADAFGRFFTKQNDFPKFKKRRTARMSFTLANDKFGVEGHYAKLPKIGEVNMAEVLRFEGKIQRGTVSLKAGHWYLSITLQRLHERIANRRLDVWHKFTTNIAVNYNTVCIEDLNIKGMVKNRKLSRAISDAGWAMGFAMLAYKCRDVRRVPQFIATSKSCNVCGQRKDDLKLSDRVWLCACGNIVDRDQNAALNIRDIGLMQPPSAFAPRLARSSVKRSRTVCKTAPAAMQVEVNTTNERAHVRTF